MIEAQPRSRSCRSSIIECKNNRDDQQLLAATARGDRDAFRQLYDRYRKAGYSLARYITRDPALSAALTSCSNIHRLNLGPLPTSRVQWDQPHEGNLFEFLYERRALQRAPAW